MEEETSIDEDELRHAIIKSQFEIALKKLKISIAPRRDGIQAEIFKFEGEKQQTSYSVSQFSVRNYQISRKIY